MALTVFQGVMKLPHSCSKMLNVVEMHRMDSLQLFKMVLNHCESTVNKHYTLINKSFLSCLIYFTVKRKPVK